MEFYKQACRNCGGDLYQIDEEHYKCKYCGSVYGKEMVEQKLLTVQKIFDDLKLEAIANARKNLYHAVNAEYISNQNVHECCFALKQFLPDDFLANFYDLAIGNNGRKIAKQIRQINIEENRDSIETIIKFLIKSLQSEYILDTNDLIERAYKATDLVKFELYSSQLAEESEKLDNCVYLTTYPRDVFVGYSSKDMPMVSELVECLEGQGISCFVAARNLRHGKGSVENYEKALQEAMDNCQSFVFVSSTNSRHPGCDALRKEIPYIKSVDIASAPMEYKNDYAKIPHRYKKHRVEYRIEESKRMVAADRITNEFFDGYERVYTVDQVADRILQRANEADESFEDVINEPGGHGHTIHATKFCVGCKKECIDTAQFCSGCGSHRFANSLMEVDLIHKVEELNKQLGQRAQEDQQAKEAEEKRERERLEEEAIARKREQAFAQAKDRAAEAAQHDADIISRILAEDRAKRAQSDRAKREAEARARLDAELRAQREAKSFVRSPDAAVPQSTSDADAIAKLVAEEKAKRSAEERVKKAAEERARREEAVKARREAEKKLMSEAATRARMALEQKSNTKAVPGQRPTASPVSRPVVRDERYRLFAQKNSVANGVLVKCKEDAYEITIPGGITTVGRQAFADCPHLTKVVIPPSVIRLDRESFWNCKYLKMLHLSKGLVSIGEEAFWGCQSLGQVNLPDSVAQIGRRAFKFCSSLHGIGVPTGVKVINEGAFHGCIALTNVYLPDSVYEIGKYAFCDCKSLANITIPVSVTKIDEFAFSGCEKLQSVVIPRSVQFLGRGAFSGCLNLRRAVVPRNLEIPEGTFGRNVAIEFV